MEGVTASAATATAKATFDKTIHVVVDIFVPVGAAVAGIFMPTILGGGQSIANAIYKTAAQNTGPGDNSNRAAWGLQGIINAAVGGAFWSLRGHGHIIARAIGGAVGGFFLGSAVGCIPGVIAGQPNLPGGLIDKLATGVQQAAASG